MNKKYLFWLSLGAYGVWFAIFSGMEEISHGKFWKVALALIFGMISVYIVEKKFKK